LMFPLTLCRDTTCPPMKRRISLDCSDPGGR
jgi:hypothetical protein